MRMLLVVLAVVAAGCRIGLEEERARYRGLECVLNSDCLDRMVCTFGTCHEECSTDKDCLIAAKQLSCVPVEKPVQVCLLEEESTCDLNSECPRGLVCGRDRRCRFQCREDVDCVLEQVCVTGLCAARADVVDGGLAAPSAGQACSWTSQCEIPLVCLGSVCRRECLTDRDCPEGKTCSPEGSCNSSGPGGRPAGWGRACVLNDDCPEPLSCGSRNLCSYQCITARDCGGGACCFQNTCTFGALCSRVLPDGGLADAGTDGGAFDGGPKYCLNDLACADGDFCNGTELCVNNVCQDASHGTCDDFNPCTTDMCNGADGGCSYVPLGPDAGDLDRDGYVDRACRNFPGPLDCDDTNALVYPGRPELCDALDNNCDGQVDEGLWREKAGSRISLQGAGRFPWWGGPPSVVPVDGGFVIAASSDTIDGALELFRTDRSLTLQQGPIALFGSRTPWVTPPGQPTFFGRRLVHPRLFAGNGQLLATGVVASAPAALPCPTGGQWAIELPVVQFDSRLGLVKPWSSVDSSVFPCTVPFSRQFAEFDVGTLAWSPGASRWVVTWPSGGTINRPVYAGDFDQDGGLSTRHELLPGQTSLITTQTGGFQDAVTPLLAVAADRALVAWHALSVYRPHYVLMDPSLNSAVSPVFELFEQTRLEGVGLSSDGQRFFVLTRFSNQPARLRELALDGGPAGGPWTLPTPQASSLTVPTGGVDSSEYTDVKPLRGGYVLTTTRWPNTTFGFLSPRSDGGVVSTTLLFPNTPRSQVVLVPIDDVTVGLVWVDGDLKRTLMECRP